MLTAVFSMRWVRGFDDQILEALKSATLRSIRGSRSGRQLGTGRGLDPYRGNRPGASAPKALRLAAIGAVANIRPAEARSILEDLADSGDEEIAEAALDAIAMAEATPTKRTRKTTKTLAAIGSIERRRA